VSGLRRACMGAHESGRAPHGHVTIVDDIRRLSVADNETRVRNQYYTDHNENVHRCVIVFFRRDIHFN
jgi:hypothetical protein